jgi:hypothetical protein
MSVPSNLANTYYAQPNQTVNGANIPSSDNTIIGAGGDTIILANNQNYAAGPGNNNVSIASGQWGTYLDWYGSGAFSINLSTGIVSNNGFGGVDTISNIENVMTGGGLSSGTIIGDSKNNQFWMLSDNNTVTGGGGFDTVIFYQIPSSQYTLSVGPNNLVTATNTKNNKSDYFTGISALQFGDVILEITNPNKIQTYKQPVFNSYYFPGTSVGVTINTINVAQGTNIQWNLNTSSPDINNNNYGGNATIGVDGNAIISIPIASNITKSESFNFNYSIDDGSIWTQATPINILPIGSITASASQVNTGSVVTLNISTQVPAGQTFNYTISGVGQADIPTIPLTGTLTADANGSASLTVPIANRGNFVGNEVMTFTSAGVSSQINIADTGAKNVNTFYAQPNQSINGNNLPININTIVGDGAIPLL